MERKKSKRENNVEKSLNYIILFFTLFSLHFNYLLLFFQNECKKEVTQVTWDGGSSFNHK